MPLTSKQVSAKYRQSKTWESRRAILYSQKKEGEFLRDALVPIRSCQEVGDILGCSGENIGQLEKKILFKIATRMRGFA